MLDTSTLPVLRQLANSARTALDAYLATTVLEPGPARTLDAGLWLLARGQARLSGRLQPLDHGAVLGAPSLWWPGAPMLTVEPVAECVWLTLSAHRFVELEREAPALALETLLAVLREQALASGPEPTQLTPSVLTSSGSSAGRPALRRRSVTVQLEGRPLVVPVGTPCFELLPEHHEHLPVVAALVDSKATSLHTPLTSNCRLEPLTTRQWEGQRIYRHSLALLALEAARHIAPDLTVRMGPSVGFGRRILAGTLANSELHEFATRLEAEMLRLRSGRLEVHEEHWTVDEARDYFDSQGWVDAKQLLGNWRDPTVPMVSYGSVYVLNITPVVTKTELLDGCFVLYDDNIVLLVYGKRSEHTLRPSQTMPPSALSVVGEAHETAAPRSTRSLLLGQAYANHEVEREERAWLSTLGVSSVGAFNHACVSGSVPGLIRVAEGFQEKRLTIIADEIERRADEIDIVCIAGPSASGKTTFIRRLCVQLQVNGINPVALGLDDYYVDRQLTPRDSSGDYDFEALEALQLELLEQHLKRLLAGELVRTSRYDFNEGKSHPAGGQELRLRPRDVLLLEGIHGLNPALLGEIPPRRVFRIFVCPLMQLAFDQLSSVHASDVRLIRRIVRDRHSRGYRAAETIVRWPKVRSAERRHIYPYQLHSDAVFDSSLVYELSVLRVYAERYLLEIPSTHPSYQTGFRLMHLLDRFVSIYPEQVPATSILREFVGGSGFDH